MLAPKNLNQSFYSEAMEIHMQIASNIDNLIARFLTDLELNRELEEKTPEEFTAYVVNHTTTHMAIQLNFSNPDPISRGDLKDRIIIKIRRPSVFMSAITLKTLKKPKNSNIVSLDTSIPP